MATPPPPSSQSASPRSRPPSAVSLGSCVAGVPVTLHYSFFVLLLLYVINAILQNGGYPLYILFVVVLYGPVLLLTIVVHEFGHVLTTKKLGGSVGGIVLWPLGGFALCGPTEALSGDLKVALAGPITHVPMGLIWWMVWVGTTGGKMGWWPGFKIYLDVLSSSPAGFFEILSAEALYLNIVLLCFNLFVPAYPLDGGRIYAASLILLFKMKAETAAKVTSITAMLLGAGMIVYAIVGWFGMWGGSVLLLGLVGVFVFHQSYELFSAARNDRLGDHPVFGRECYQNANNGGGGGGGETAGGAVPAQTDEAVMA
ncbi:hypothetical protein ACHAWF_006345 [Thalassiosira exigua]